MEKTSAPGVAAGGGTYHQYPGPTGAPVRVGSNGQPGQAPKDLKDAAGEHDLAPAALCETIMLEPKVEWDEDLKKAITLQER